jgi:hypothetical protein
MRGGQGKGQRMGHMRGWMGLVAMAVAAAARSPGRARGRCCIMWSWFQVRIVC